MVAAVERRPKIPKTHCWKGKPLPPIFFEDPEPVEDGMRQQPTIDRIAAALRDWFPNDFVSAGGFIMPDPEDGNNRFAPDLYIAFGVTWEQIVAWRLPNYWAWIVKKMPDFALEVASPSTAKRDTDFKRGLYLRLGFDEYCMLDATGEHYGKPITILRRVGDGFEEAPIHEEPDGSLWSYSELLDLEFWWISDARVWDPFDVRDPRTGKSICIDVQLDEERQARIVAEIQARVDREARLAKRDALIAEREARADAERQAQSEREARIAAESETERLRELVKRLEGLMTDDESNTPPPSEDTAP